MNSGIPTSIRRCIALAAAVVVAGCSSGGGNGSPPEPGPPVTVTLTNAQQAYEADASMSATNAIRLASLFAALFNIKTGEPLARPDTQLHCKHGVETSTTFPTPENIDVIVNLFYDPACKKPFVKSKFFAFVHLPNAVTVTGTQTTYALDGTAVAYGKISGTAHPNSTGNTAVFTGTLSRSQGGAPLMSFGLSCSVSSTGKNNCGFGAVNDLISRDKDLGVTSSLENFVGSGTSKDGTTALHAYAGKPGRLRLRQGPGLSWVVSGGSVVASEAGTFDEAVNARTFAIDLDLSLVDGSIDAGSTAKLDRNGIAGTVLQKTNALQAATFSTVPAGTGAIHYYDGSTGNIAFFFVI